MAIARNTAALDALGVRLTAEGARVATCVADGSDRAAIDRVISMTTETFGGFDSWVNKAGVGTYGTLEQVPIEDHRRVFDVNYFGVLSTNLESRRSALRRRHSAFFGRFLLHARGFRDPLALEGEFGAARSELDDDESDTADMEDAPIHQSSACAGSGSVEERRRMMNTIESNANPPEATPSAKVMKKAAGIAYAYLCNAFEDAQDDECIDYRLMGRIAKEIACEIDNGAVHAASTLDGARMVLASWCMKVEEARGDPELPVTIESACLAHSIAISLGVPHLLRGTTDNPRSGDVRFSVEAAVLLRAMFDGNTQLDRDLASVAGLPDSSSAADRAIAARGADVKADRLVAPSSCPDGEWWSRAEAADRAALTKVFPQKNCERLLEPSLYEYLTAAGEGMLYRLDTMKTSRSRATSWEEQAVNLTSRYICDSLSQRGWRREHERLAAAAGRHFDAMAAGEEHAATIADSARMILIDWALTSDRSMAAGSASVAIAARDRAMRALEDAGLAHLSARDEPHLRPQALHEQVRDAARRAVSLNRGTRLDVDLHRFNDSLVEGNVAASGRLAGQHAATRGFVHPYGETAAGVASWAERQARETSTRIALDEATSALQDYRTRYTQPAAPIIYLSHRGRTDIEPEELAAFEPHVAHPGERVRFSAPESGTASVMTIAETLALRGRDGRLVARYRVDGGDHDYGDEDLVRLGRRHTDGGRVLLDRATWSPPTRRLSLVASRAMNAGMGM